MLHARCIEVSPLGQKRLPEGGEANGRMGDKFWYKGLECMPCGQVVLRMKMPENVDMPDSLIDHDISRDRWAYLTDGDPPDAGLLVMTTLKARCSDRAVLLAVAEAIMDLRMAGTSPHPLE